MSVLRPAELPEDASMAANAGYAYIYEAAPARPATAAAPATGPTYRNVAAKNGFPSLDGITTLYELFQASVKKFGDKPCLGHRAVGPDGAAGPYSWETYSQVDEKVAAVGSALKAAGLGPQSRVGVFGANSPEWMTAMQACNRHAMYCVPLYDSLGENAIEYIIHHAEVSLVFVSAEKLAGLAAALPKVADRVKTVVVWGAANAAAQEKVKAAGVALQSWSEFLDAGRASPALADPPKPDEYCTIMYTSGTTGDPKGVLLKHSAVVATVAGQDGYLKQIGTSLGPNDVMLSYLPLAHIFDRAAEEMFLYLGGRIGYWRGDIKGLVDDIGALKPTLFLGVPRVFERIYAGVLAKMVEAGGLKKFLFDWGYNRKSAALARGVSHTKASPIFDKLVFSKVKQRLGGNVRIIVTGGAPLAKHVEDFLRVTMMAPVVQGYGLTETCAASFIAWPDRADAVGTVGPCLPHFSFRLEAVPEMNYDPAASPPRGEVCIHGPPLFSGYYKMQDKTDEVLDKDGWFHTGDVGEISPQGFLKIIDRKKNIFKLSQGEYIAVEKLEEVYKKNTDADQVWVYGNSFESTLVAVVVPHEGPLMSWAKANNVPGTFAEVVKSPAARKHILTSLTQTGRENKLKGFEIVKGVYLDSVPFSPENELQTPTYKLKRPQLLKHYKAEIDDMYKQINAAAPKEK